MVNIYYHSIIFYNSMAQRLHIAKHMSSILLALVAGCRQPMPEICKPDTVPTDFAPLAQTTDVGNLVAWPIIEGQTQVDVYVDTDTLPDLLDLDEALLTAQDSFAAWENAAHQSIRFDVYALDERDDEAEQSYGYVNTVTFEPDWQADEDKLAVTSTSYDSVSGNIVGFDMVFNARDFTWSNAAQTPEYARDFGAVMTHEVGHSLGLLDLYDCEDPEDHYSIMCNTYTPSRTLFDFDVHAMDAFYGECAP